MFSIRTFRYVAFIEATSFLLLLIASAIKRTGGSELGVQVLGPIHGILFLAYLFLVLNLRAEAGWSGKTTALLALGAIVPFGGYVVDRWLAKTGGQDEIAPSRR